MTKYKFTKKDLIIIATVILTTLFSVYRLISVTAQGLINNCDHIWIWFDSNLAWQHYDLYRDIEGQFLYDGFTVHGEISAMPWGVPFNTLLHGGFLPREASIIWYSAMRLIFFVIMCVAVWKKFDKLGMEGWKKSLAMITFIAPWSNISCLTAGNQGQVIVMWIVTAVCLVDDNDYLAAVFMTLSMIKPQTALPFFALFLLRKKWKIIVPSVIAVFASWGVCALWTHSNPIIQIEGILKFTNDLYWDIHVVGICDFMRKILGFSDNVAMLSSMVTGIAILAVCVIVVLKNKQMDNFQLYSIPAIVSIFWCYKSECDYIIVIIAGLAILTLWDSNKLSIGTLIGLAVVYLMFFTKPFSQALLGGWMNLSRYYCYLLDVYMKVIALVLLVVYMKKHCNNIS